MSRASRRLIARVREEQAFRLIVEEGLTSREIADRLGISQSAASRALRRAEARSLAAINDLVVSEKVRQVERLTHLYRESMTAWRGSKKDRVTKRSRQTDNAAGVTKVGEVRTEEQVGDARFLAEARGAMSDLRRVLGLEKVTVDHHHHRVERPAADLTEEELDKQLAEVALEHQRKAGGGDRPH